jgi:hypothetical protein
MNGSGAPLLLHHLLVWPWSSVKTVADSSEPGARKQGTSRAGHRARKSLRISLSFRQVPAVEEHFGPFARDGLQGKQDPCKPGVLSIGSTSSIGLKRMVQ